MRIQKKMMIAVLAVGLGLAGLQQASAKGWGGGMRGGMGGGGDCSCYGSGPGYQMLDESTKAQVDSFRADTLELRRQIAMKRAEKMALFEAENPDPAAIAKVAGELFDLRTQMETKAQAAGVPIMGGQGRQGKMQDFSGRRGPGRGMGPCMYQSGLN